MKDNNPSELKKSKVSEDSNTLKKLRVQDPLEME